MKTLYVKQKLWSLKEKFTVTNVEQQDLYFVEGSFLKIPKSYTIRTLNGKEIAVITKKIITFLPKFEVDILGQPPVIIQKDFTFFKDKYSILSEGIEVRGDWWDLSFEVYKDHQLIGSVESRLFTWADTYEIQVQNEQFEHLMVALTVAIDCVKNDKSSVTDVSFIGD